MNAVFCVLQWLLTAGDDALLWSPGFAVHIAWAVLAIPAARPGCWLKLSLLLAHSPSLFLPSRAAAAQPDWRSPYGCRRWPIPGLGLIRWHSVWHFCSLIPPASPSGWQPCLPPLGCHPWAFWWSGWSPPLCVCLCLLCVYVCDLKCKCLFHYSSAAIGLKTGLNPANQNELSN